MDIYLHRHNWQVNRIEGTTNQVRQGAFWEACRKVSCRELMHQIQVILILFKFILISLKLKCKKNFGGHGNFSCCWFAKPGTVSTTTERRGHIVYVVTMLYEGETYSDLQ